MKFAQLCPFKAPVTFISSFHCCTPTLKVIRILR